MAQSLTAEHKRKISEALKKGGSSIKAGVTKAFIAPGKLGAEIGSKIGAKVGTITTKSKVIRTANKIQNAAMKTMNVDKVMPNNTSEIIKKVGRVVKPNGMFKATAAGARAGASTGAKIGRVAGKVGAVGAVGAAGYGIYKAVKQK